LSKRHKGEEHEEHVDESWLVPYADILTLLLALFIVLYSMNSVDVKKFSELSNAFSIALSSGQGVLDSPSVIERGPSMEQILKGGDKEENKDSTSEEQLTEEQLQELIEKGDKELSTLKEQIDEYIDLNGLSTSLETSLNMSQLLITIRDSALFASGDAKVNNEGRELANSIAKMIENYPDFNIIISGHTDNTPIHTSEFKSNWDLSAMRAIRFQDLILANSKLDPKRFSTQAYGEYHPVAPNTDAANKAKNRRVEISIVNYYADQAKQQIIPAQ